MITKNIQLALLFLVSLLLLGNSSLLAQRKNQVGLVFSPLMTDFLYSSHDKLSKAKPGFTLELLYKMPLSMRTHLTTGLGYGYRIRAYGLVNANSHAPLGHSLSEFWWQEEVAVQSVLLPIYFRTKLTKNPEGLFFGYGLLPSLAIRSKSKINTGEGDPNDFYFEVDNRKFFQLLSQFSIGWHIQGESRLAVSFELFGGFQLAGKLHNNGLMGNGGLRLGFWL